MYERSSAARFGADTASVAASSSVIDGAEAFAPGIVRYERYPQTGHGIFADRPEAMELVKEFLPSPEPA